jgi:capsule polysaccharide export protein KpsE/RkpR
VANEVQHLKHEVTTLQQQLLQQQQRAAQQATRLADVERAHADLKLESERWKQRYYAALGKVGPRSKIPPEMLRRLLWLCHPDRHGDSETATATTTWLLAQRSKG